MSLVSGDLIHSRRGSSSSLSTEEQLAAEMLIGGFAGEEVVNPRKRALEEAPKVQEVVSRDSIFSSSAPPDFDGIAQINYPNDIIYSRNDKKREARWRRASYRF